MNYVSIGQTGSRQIWVHTVFQKATKTFQQTTKAEDSL